MTSSQQSATQRELPAGQSFCKSIIAVDGWRRRDLNTNSNDVSNDFHLSNFHGDTHNGDDDTIRYGDDEEEDTDEEFVCELYDGVAVPIKGTDGQLRQLRMMLNNGSLVSAESTVEVEPPSLSSAFGDEEGHAIEGVSEEAVPDSISLPPGKIRLIVNNGSGDDSDINFRRRRRLNALEGTKNVLVVRVTDKASRAVDREAAYISNKIFGTGGDKVTMKSGFEACSFDKFRVSTNYGGNFRNKLFSAPGVVDVDIRIRLDSSTQSSIREAAVRAVNEKLNVELPGPFDHVIFLLEKCYPVGTSCGFGGYAYVNHWLSVFVEENYIYPAVVMHELGHNLNMAHSGGLDGLTYTDWTCLMGNPLWEDDVGQMCFNPVKNYQIAKGMGR